MPKAEAFQPIEDEEDDLDGGTDDGADDGLESVDDAESREAAELERLEKERMATNAAVVNERRIREREERRRAVMASDWRPDSDTYILVPQDESTAAKARANVVRRFPGTQARVVSEIDLRRLTDRNVILCMPQKDIGPSDLRFETDAQGNRHHNPEIKFVICKPVSCALFWRMTADNDGRVNPKSKIDERGRKRMGLVQALNVSIANGMFECDTQAEDGTPMKILERAPLSSQVRWRSEQEMIFLSPV